MIEYALCRNECGRLLRPIGTKAADHPGTHLRASKGMCARCYVATSKKDRSAVVAKILEAERELTSDEVKVLARVKFRFTGDEFDQVVSMLGIGVGGPVLDSQWTSRAFN